MERRAFFSMENLFKFIFKLFFSEFFFAFVKGGERGSLAVKIRSPHYLGLLLG